MTGAVMSRARIAQLADDVAATWVRNPHLAKPVNPFDPVTEPEHHAAWRASFERSLVCHSAPCAETSA